MNIRFSGKQINESPIDLSAITVTISTRNLDRLLEMRIDGEFPLLRKRLSDGTMLYLVLETDEMHYADEVSADKFKISSGSLKI